MEEDSMGNRPPAPQVLVLFALCLLSAVTSGGPGTAGDCNQNGVEDLQDLSPRNFGFQEQVVPPLSFRPVVVAVFDVEGDGDLDLATASTTNLPGNPSVASVLLNGGRGSFSVPESISVGESA